MAEHPYRRFSFEHVPESDGRFVYHGTTTSRFSSIGWDGLVPQSQQSWHQQPEGASEKVIWFAAEPEFSADWARSLSEGDRFGALPVLLRVPLEVVGGVAYGSEDEPMTYWGDQTVKPEQIEVFTDDGWLNARHAIAPDLYDATGALIPFEAPAAGTTPTPAI